MHRRLTQRVTVLYLLVLLGGPCVPSFALAIDAPPSRPGSAPNYDIRRDTAPAARGALARMRLDAGRSVDAAAAYRQRAEAAEQVLRASVPGLRIGRSRALGTPETIGTDPLRHSALTSLHGSSRVETLRAFMREFPDLYGIPAADVPDLATEADERSAENSLAFVRFVQRIHDLPVFQAEVAAAFDARDMLVHTVGNLAADLDPGTLARDTGDPRVLAVAAAAAIGVDIASAELAYMHEPGRDVSLAIDAFVAPVRAQALYFPIEPGVARLAWRFTFWQPATAWTVIVDADDGRLLWRKQLVEHQTQPVTYAIYSGNSPAEFAPSQVPQSPNGAQPSMLNRSQEILIGNEEPNTFNNLGWITDGNNTTAGNNVIAGLDRVAPDGLDTNGIPSGSGFRVFQPLYNPAPGNPAPGAEPASPNYPPTLSTYQIGAIVNAFYWSNRFHDRTYRLGFTEQARNFQVSNFGRGGLGNDRVRAEIQDTEDVNNANFATPADGQEPRMQMFLWTDPTPARDGSLDRQILVHELSHGLSNRLIGNADGLGETQPRGLGEGWSDFFALTLFASASSGTTGRYPLAAYSMYQRGSTGTNNYYYGIRRYPYALISSTGGPEHRPHNPLTFADIDPDQILINDGAYPRDPADTGSPGSATSVHKIGEVWASALLEGRARIIERLGFADGNARMLQIVVNAMRLTALEPDLIDARDAVLAAAQAMGGSDLIDLWQGFAVRGMGADASTDGVHVVESFDIPGISANTAPTVSDAICNANGSIDPGEAVDLRIPLRNTLGASVADVTLAINGAAPVSYGTMPANSTRTRTLPARVPNLACGANWTLDLAVESSAGPATARHLVRLGTPVYAIDQDFDATIGAFPPPGWTRTLIGANALWQRSADDYASAPYAAHIDAPAAAGESMLTTPTIAIGNVAAELSFRHRYDLETAHDGGVLEISINGGAWYDIIQRGGRFLAGSYDGMLEDKCLLGGDNPIEGRYAWSGESGNWGVTRVVLPQESLGQDVRLRWRFGTDCSVAGGGWTIDNVRLRSSFQCTVPVCSDLIFRHGLETTP